MSYKLTHPNGGELEANADQVAMYESQGWELNAKSPSEGDEKNSKK